MSKSIIIDLAARYAAAFGMLAVGKQIDRIVKVEKKKSDYNFKIFDFKQDDVEYVQLQIPGADVLTFNSILIGDNGDNIFAPPLLMGFSQEKSLIETEVNDDDPIIVERWGTKPFEITINGLLIDLKNRFYPTDEIRRLNKTWQYNGIIKVVGKQFEELDIDSIYFRSITFTRLEGYQDTVQFTLNASAIKAVNFTLLKPTKSKVVVGDLVLTGFSS